MALVEYELSGDVAVLTLNRPDKRNAISDGLIAELSDAVDRAASEAKAGVICANAEETLRVIGERQLALLHELAARAARLASASRA